MELIMWELEKCLHEVLVIHLVKLAQEKNVVRWTDPLVMTIADDRDVRTSIQTNKQNKTNTFNSASV